MRQAKFLFFPQIVKFLSDQHANLIHLKFNLVLTIIYESPVIGSNENGEVVEQSIKSSHESLRKGKYNFYFYFLSRKKTIVGIVVLLQT